MVDDFPARERPRLNLDNLTDVNAGAPADGDGLYFTGTGWAKGPARRLATAKADDATLALTDAGHAVEVTKGTAVTITVPTNAAVAFPIGTELDVVQMGAGQVTLAAAGGVTLRSVAGLKTTGQYAVAKLRKRAVNEWVVSGATTAS